YNLAAVRLFMINEPDNYILGAFDNMVIRNDVAVRCCYKSRTQARNFPLLGSLGTFPEKPFEKWVIEKWICRSFNCSGRRDIYHGGRDPFRNFCHRISEFCQKFSRIFV